MPHRGAAGGLTKCERPPYRPARHWHETRNTVGTVSYGKAVCRKLGIQNDYLPEFPIKNGSTDLDHYLPAARAAHRWSRQSPALYLEAQ